VCEDVADEGVHRRREVVGGGSHRQRQFHCLDLQPPPLVDGEGGPEVRPFHDDRRGVASLAQALPHRPSGLVDDLVDSPADRVDVGQQPVAVGPGQRLGVQPQCRQGGAQPVGEIGGGLTFGGQELADPPGQPVHRRPHLADLRRSGRGGAGGEVAAAQSVRRRGEVGDRPGEGPREPVGDHECEEQQDDP
jgi:hypothetical protein